MSKVTYACGTCGKEKTVDSGAAVPVCCGGPMAHRNPDPPPHTMTAEADRFEDEDDAFNDGVH